MLRSVVLVGVLVAVVFSGGALADVSFVGLNVTVRRADGRAVTARVTRATTMTCGGAPCDPTSLKPGAVVVQATVGRLGDGVRYFRRLELASSR